MDTSKSKTKITEELRKKYFEYIASLCEGAGEEVLIVKSNVFALPCVDSNGDDRYVTITVSVPSGERNGEGYDGHYEAKCYAEDCETKEAEKQKKEIAKQAKIARDKALREEKARLKAEVEAKKNKGE